MIHLGGGAKSFTQAKTLAKKMIKSGKALEKFREALFIKVGTHHLSMIMKLSLNQNMFTMSFLLNQATSNQWTVKK